MKLSVAFVAAAIGFGDIVQALPISPNEINLFQHAALSSRDIPRIATTITGSADQVIHRNTVNPAAISSTDLLRRDAVKSVAPTPGTSLISRSSIAMDKIAEGWGLLRSEVRRPPVQEAFSMPPPNSEVRMPSAQYDEHDAGWHKDHHALLHFKSLSSQRQYEDLLRYSNEYDEGHREGVRQLNQDEEADRLKADIHALKNEDGHRQLPNRPDGELIYYNIYREWAPLYNAALEAHKALEGGMQVAGRVDLQPKTTGGLWSYSKPLWSDPWKREGRRTEK